jgi:hypothetical protein
MRIRYFAWFDSKAERTEFISILNNSRSEIDAINKLMNRFPELKMAEISGVVDNFKKEINKKS